MTYSFAVEDITPERAAAILAANPSNRALKKGIVAQIAADIKDGRWLFNGQPILISEGGELIDGQHRLSAIIKAGVPVQCAVVGGIDFAARRTVDTGTSRTAGDLLQLSGHSQGNLLASITRMVMSYERTDGRSISNTHISKTEINERADADSALKESMAFGRRATKTGGRLGSGSVWGCVHYITEALQDVRAENYLHSCAYGMDLSKGDPALAVRDRLFQMTDTGGSGQVARVETLLRGWIAERDGRALSVVRLNGKLPNLVFWAQNKSHAGQNAR